MDFGEVCTFFGGTIFYEEFRGDLEDVGKKIEEHIVERTDSPASDRMGSSFLLHAIYQMMLGDMLKAEAFLVGLFSLNISPRWNLRSMVYRMLMEQWKTHPAIFNPRALVKNLPMTIWWTKKRTRRHYELRKYCEDNQDTPGTVIDSVNRLELDLIIVLGEEMPLVATLAHRQDHAMYEVRNTAVGKLMNLLQLAKDANLPDVVMYVHSLLYDVEYLCQTPQLPERLAAWKADLEKCHCPHSYGIYEMKLGDALFHATFSNPFFPSIVAIEPPDHIGSEFAQYNPLFGPQSHQTVSSQESDQARVDLPNELARRSRELAGLNAETSLSARDSILEAYKRAESKFSESGCGAPRAVAAIHIRKSAVYAVQALTPTYFYGRDTQERKLEERKLEQRAQAARDALEHLKKSVELFKKCGDRQGHDLASICSLLIRSASSDEAETVELPTSIAQRLAKEGSDGLVLHLGLLAMRVANRFRYLCGEPVASCRAYEVARRIFRENIFPTVLVQSMLSSASGMITLGYYAGARLWYRHLDKAIKETSLLKKILDGVLIDLNRDATLVPDPHTEPVVDHVQRLKFCTAMVVLLIDTFLADEKLFNSSDQTDHLIDIKALFKIVEDNSQFSEEARAAAKGWIGRCERRIARLKTIIWNELFQSLAIMDSANEIGIDCLNSLERSQVTDFELKSDLVEIAMRVGKKDLAEKTLEQIQDDEQTLTSYEWISCSPVARQLEEYRATLFSSETLLRLCIRVGSWQRAASIMTRIEELSPDCFTSPSGYTATYFWQRCLYASLVREGLRDTKNALKFLGQSNLVWNALFAEMSLDPTTRKQVRNHPDVLCLQDTLVDHFVSCGEMIPEASRPFISQDHQLWRDFGFLEHTTETTRINVWSEALHILETGRSQFIAETSAAPTSAYSKFTCLSKVERYAELNGRHWRLDDGEKEELARLDKDISQIQSSLTHYEVGERSSMSSGLSSSIKALQDELLIPMIVDWILPEHVLVVYLVTSERGLTSFAIAHGGIKYAHRNNKATGFYIRELVSKFLANIQPDLEVDDDQEKAEDPALNKELNRELSTLLIGEGIEKCMHNKTSIIFIPTGVLSRIPFGALLYHDEYLILSKSVSVAPTLFCLTHLFIKSASSSVSGEPVRKFRFLGKPKQFSVEEQPLVMALPEAMVVAETLHTGHAESTESYGRMEFRKLLEDADVLHLCTHGEIQRDSPFNSTLSMNGKFPVIELLAIKTDIKLITLSACFSGTGHSQYDGDAFSFSHFLLAGGARNLIGALWAVDDIVALLHMLLFYMEMVAAEKATSLADLWRKATMILQKMSKKQALALLKFMSERLFQVEHLYPLGFISEEHRRSITDHLKNFENAEIDLSHPRHWAAFTLFGNADYRFSIKADPPYKAVMKILLHTMANRAPGDED